MKAVRLNQWATPVSVEDIPQPQPGADEVLVRVRAASVNPLDAFVHAGYMQAMMSLPITLGTDFAGDVEAVGAEVKHVRAGDAVYGLVPMHSGSFAEYTLAKTNEVAHKPKSLDYTTAAGVPLASLAAYQSLFTLGEAKAGERILILGAGGAAGACALQLAKELGATVYAVDIAEKAGFVKQFGPDRFIDGKAEKYEDVAGTVDLVLDFVSPENLARCYKILQPGGRFVSALLMAPPPEEAAQRGISVKGLGTQPRVDQLDDLARRIDAGRLKVFVNRTFPLDQAQAALDFRPTSTQPGKVVLTV